MILLDGNHSLLIHRPGFKLLGISPFYNNRVTRPLIREIQKMWNSNKCEMWKIREKLDQLILEVPEEWGKEKGLEKFNLYLRNSYSGCSWIFERDIRKITGESFINPRMMRLFTLVSWKDYIRVLNYYQIPHFPQGWNNKINDRVERKIISALTEKLDNWENYSSVSEFFPKVQRRLSKFKTSLTSDWKLFGISYCTLYISHKLGIV